MVVTGKLFLTESHGETYMHTNTTSIISQEEYPECFLNDELIIGCGLADEQKIHVSFSCITTLLKLN